MPRWLYLTVIIVLVANVLANAAWVIESYGGLKDLDSFLHSGAAYARGFDPYQYHWWLAQQPISREALNLNPPISVYLFEPLSFMDHDIVAAGFFIVSIAMVAGAVGLLMRAYPEKRNWLVVLLVVSMAGVWHMLWYLQIYAPLVLAMTGAWLLMRRGDWLVAGILIGLVVAIKPNYALVPLVLFAAGHWRPAIAAGAAAGVVSLVPLVIDGPEIYRQWLQMTMQFEGYEWTSNASLVSAGERLDVGFVGYGAAALLTIAVSLFAWRLRPAPLDALALGLMTVILVGPVSWAGYTLLLLPYLFSVRWDRWTWVTIAILATPFAPERLLELSGLDIGWFGASSEGGASVLAPVGNVLATVFGPVLGALYAWAVLLLLCRFMQRLAEAHGYTVRGVLRMPAPRRTASRPAGRRPVRPSSSEFLPGGAAPVAVRYDQ